MFGPVCVLAVDASCSGGMGSYGLDYQCAELAVRWFAKSAVKTFFFLRFLSISFSRSFFFTLSLFWKPRACRLTGDL